MVHRQYGNDQFTIKLPATGPILNELLNFMNHQNGEFIEKYEDYFSS